MWYRTFNILYYSCSTAPSVLEESGQVYFSCTRIPGSLLFFLFIEKDWTTLLACLLASIQKRTSPTEFAHLAEKSENGSVSNLSTKARTSTASWRRMNEEGSRAHGAVLGWSANRSQRCASKRLQRRGWFQFESRLAFSKVVDFDFRGRHSELGGILQLVLH